MRISENKISNKRAKDPIDQLIVLLNNKKIIKASLSEYKRLKKASQKQLEHFECDGMGIHWANLDEDLSLRGFLKYELAHIDKPLVS